MVSADTACARFKHIDVSDGQITVMKADGATWRPLALQIKGHNDEYEKACTK